MRKKSNVIVIDPLTAMNGEEAREKIALFRGDPHHSSLKTHKLKGHLRKYWSFRVNYAYRIIFEYDAKNVAALLEIGTHSIYQ